MTKQTQPYLTEAMYLEHERNSIDKHEYYAGEMRRVARANEKHNLIAVSLAASLHSQLRGRPCRVYPSDMRVKVMQTGLNTYPDLAIVCGTSQFTEDKHDTLINPTVIIEILSPSTERYDRGMKFQHYRGIATLQEYILVAQDKHHIERFARQDHSNEWLFSEAVGLETSLFISSVQVTLALSDVYEQVLLPDEPLKLPRSTTEAE